MTAPRLRKREVGRSTPRAVSKTLVMTRALASPLGILTVFPALVLAVGVFLSLVGQQALKGSNVALGRSQLERQAALVAANLRVALEQSDPMLDQLSGFALGHDSSKPLEPVAAVLRDLIRGRAGVSYCSISFPDGVFEGAYVDTDGTVRFQHSRIENGTTRVQRFDYRGHAAIHRIDESTNEYDPRKREFYQLAVAKGRVWTPPYTFYGSHFTGVTRTEPVFKNVDGVPALHAVLTVDFDVHALSRLLRMEHIADMRTLLYTGSGTLLAYPEGEKAIAALPLKFDRALSYRDLDDPALNAFFSELAKSPADDELVKLEANGAKYLAMRAHVSKDRTLDFSVAYLVPESVFFESLHSYGARSAAIAGVAVLLAFGVSYAFARLIVKARREVADARAEAQRANHEAMELGSYRLDKCLGKGGMGEVWRAQHRLLAREAAIKLIRIDRGKASREAQERFRREAQTLAALRSRNTIELFDYGVSDDGTFFYVMELLDGLDLDSLVEQHGPQPPGRVVRLLTQACRSLAEAHEAGLVHRDIKPANIFVCRAADEVDVVKVLDFGLVRSLESADEALPPVSGRGRELASLVDAEAELGAHLTRQGAVMGTPEFMAPEQALGQALDGRADIYALGCVGYWLLTGRAPFRKDSSMQMLLAHITETPPPPSGPAPIPPLLESAIMACLEKSAAQRPESARQLQERLIEAERQLGTEDLWSEEAARSWWDRYQPVRKPSQPSTSPLPETMRIADAVGQN